MKENLHWPEPLRLLMKMRGEMSNLALAREINVSHVAVGNWLNGDFPKGDNLMALANFFCVTTDELLGRVPVKIPETGMMLRESPPEYLVDDVLAEVQNLKETLAALERKIKKLKST